MVIMMELQLQPLAAEGNGLLARNPDRGLRLELYMGEEIACDVFTVSRMANPAAHIERVIEKGIARCAPEQITLAQVYFYLTGYRGGEIDEAGFQAMQIYFDTLRAHGLKALLRFAYSTDPGVNDATQADMLRHIEQLRPFLERNKAYIHVLQAGMIGAWGEWHSEKKRVSRKKILRALAQAAPEGMYLQVRLPGLLKLLGKRHPAYCRTQRTKPTRRWAAGSGRRSRRSFWLKGGFPATSPGFATNRASGYPAAYLHMCVIIWATGFRQKRCGWRAIGSRVHRCMLL